MHPVGLLKVLVLIVLANATPVIAAQIFGARFSHPLDAHATFADGRPLFGRSKTVRGVLLALIVTAAAAPLLGLDPALGLLAAATAMAGDLASSFLKRRLGLAASDRATGLDQIPESLFPLVACSPMLGLNVLDVAAGTVIFLIGEILISRVLYRLRLRDRPY
jgi:CDP-2,3-bis-(O-geranylgeranyl)-sn-glycerol synthase